MVSTYFAPRRPLAAIQLVINMLKLLKSDLQLEYRIYQGENLIKTSLSPEFNLYARSSRRLPYTNQVCDADNQCIKGDLDFMPDYIDSEELTVTYLNSLMQPYIDKNNVLGWFSK